MIVLNFVSVSTFWTVLSLLLLFAYPTPEFATPSFEYHTAFNGVALGIVRTAYLINYLLLVKCESETLFSIMVLNFVLPK